MVLVARTPVMVMVVMSVPTSRNHQRSGKRHAKNKRLLHFSFSFTLSNTFPCNKYSTFLRPRLGRLAISAERAEAEADRYDGERGEDDGEVDVERPRYLLPEHHPH